MCHSSVISLSTPKCANQFGVSENELQTVGALVQKTFADNVSDISGKVSKKLSYRRDSQQCVKRSFKVT